MKTKDEPFGDRIKCPQQSAEDRNLNEPFRGADIIT